MRKRVFGGFVGLVLLVLVGAVFCPLSGEERSSEGKEEEKKSRRSRRGSAIIRDSQVRVVTVTAAPVAGDVREAASPVSTLERGDLEMFAASGALGALHGIPGVFVQRSGDFGRADADIRGLGQNCRRIAVLVDGKPEKMGLFGCAVSHAFPLDNVERIEVVKGPASVLYGGEALGGAVNIITHMPERKFENEINASYGGFNTRQFNLRHGANWGKFKYFLTCDRRLSDGHRENSQYSGWSATGKALFEIAPGARLSFGVKYFDGDKHEPGPVGAPVYNYWNVYRRGAVDLSFSKTGERDEYAVFVYRNFGAHRFSDGFDSHDYTNGISGRFTRRFSQGGGLTVGGDWRGFGGSNKGFPRGEWNKSEGSLFLHNQMCLGGKWIVSGGVRLQMDSLFGSEWCPRVGLVYRVSPEMELRASLDKGFRSPQLNELYMFPPANADLEPERVWNYEMGFGRRFGERVQLRGSVFYMNGTNLIETIPNPKQAPKFIFANSGGFSFYGVEAELEVRPLDVLSMRLGYSWLETGTMTRGRPGQKWDLDFRAVFSPVSLMFQGQYVLDYYAQDRSRQPIPPYFTVNGRIAVQILESMDIVVDVINLFDQDYSVYGEFPGLTSGLYRMPGRYILTGVRIRP